MFSFLCLNTFLMFFHNYFLKVVDFIFGSCPKSIVKIEQNVQWLQYTFYAPPNKPCTQFSLCLLSHISLEYLLILVNLNQYNIINYSPQFTLVFVLFCFAHLWIFKCIMSHVYHYSSIQHNFTALKNPICSTYSSIPSITLISGNHWPFLFLY